ncbi:MAG TPA: hydrogenase formation protein HypD [bacterium]|nr:hydrogenase formation protein HypD [bacterium]
MTDRVVEGFKEGAPGRAMIQRIKELSGGRRVTFMEVCGTHTVEFFKSGLRSALSDYVRLVSGPGCPVCVTPNSVIDRAVAYSLRPDTLVTTFGDMIRVPGSVSSLEKAKSEGGRVRIVYSTLDALNIARANPKLNVVFMGIGFETTSPTVAASIEMASKQGVPNYSVLCSHKVIPPALEALASGGEEIDLQGFLCPGHVSVIIGSRAYAPIAEKRGIPCVITGFEPLDMAQGILMLLEQAVEGRSEVENQYSRAVRAAGNGKALALIDRVFEIVDSEWRGFGIMPGAGFGIKEAYADFDAEKRWSVEVEPSKEHPGCRCAEVLRGRILPVDCPLFKKVCTPQSPVGACMVSSEGTCAAYYKYGSEKL